MPSLLGHSNLRERPSITRGSSGRIWATPLLPQTSWTGITMAGTSRRCSRLAEQALELLGLGRAPVTACAHGLRRDRARVQVLEVLGKELVAAHRDPFRNRRRRCPCGGLIESHFQP